MFQNEFNILNDNELIYLCRLGNNKPIFNIINKYKKEINFIKINTLNKFNNLPLEICDLDSYIYYFTLKAINQYSLKYNKSFKNYLFLMIKWNILNLINKYLTNKYKVLNYYIDFSKLDNIIIKNNLINYEKISKEKLYNLIFQKINKLTKLEKEIFLYKLSGKSNEQILNLTKYSYKRIDNAFQRAILKLK